MTSFVEHARNIEGLLKQLVTNGGGDEIIMAASSYVEHARYIEALLTQIVEQGGGGGGSDFPASGDYSMNNHKLTNLATPLSGGDAARLTEVSNLKLSITYKYPCLVATIGNITLSGEQTIDDIDVVASNKVLVKDQDDQSENGLYVCQVGAWLRNADATSGATMPSGTIVLVLQGTINTLSLWVLSTDDPITVGTTDLIFAKLLPTSGGSSFPPANDLDMGGFLLTNLSDPGNDTDAANKEYVDGLASTLMPNLIGSEGDLIVGGTAGGADVLTKGSNGQVLTVDPASPHHVIWANGGIVNPMTTAGDLILGGTAGAPGRLGKGADNKVLTIDPTTHLPVWATPAAGGATVLETQVFS